MKRWRYHYAGLNVLSDIHIPEWECFETSNEDNSPDVRIVLEDAIPESFVAQISADCYSFQINEIGAYRIQHGNLIQIAVHPKAGMREIRLFLLGTAWGVLCYQCGILVLHASVVEVGGEAVAFCGVSGAGKSTLAAWLLDQGYSLIADDLCRFDISGTRPGVFPAAPRLKLWRDALDHLNRRTGDLERDHFRMEKFHLPVTNGRAGQPVVSQESPFPLRAVYLLRWGELEIVRLKGMNGLYSLIEAATYRGELLEPMGLTADHWNRCVCIARSVPIFRLTRPQDWSAAPESKELVLASLQTLASFSGEKL
jgi:hypothetical protein